jgi:muramoyltetrapeptide carboxypeptidase
MPILPECLRPGDTVALVSPASPPPDPKAIDPAIAAIESLGFRVKLGRNARRRNGYLAGSDRERADDLMRAFADTKVRGIFCVRGGYGSARLLPLLDYKLIHRNPKVFVGYSDLTSLHCALLVKAGLVSFHGPMAVSDFLGRDTAPTRECLLRTVQMPAAAGSILKGCARPSISILRSGAAAGQIIGGNLSVLCATVGTPWQPPFRGRILFLEDVDERPYRIDRLLTHLLNAGLLQQVAGVAVGICTGCEDPAGKRTRESRQTLKDVLAERLRPLDIPVVIGLPFGHTSPNATLPFGGHALLDARRGDLVIAKAAVS